VVGEQLPTSRPLRRLAGSLSLYTSPSLSLNPQLSFSMRPSLYHITAPLPLSHTTPHASRVLRYIASSSSTSKEQERGSPRQRESVGHSAVAPELRTHRACVKPCGAHHETRRRCTTHPPAQSHCAEGPLIVYTVPCSPRMFPSATSVFILPPLSVQLPTLQSPRYAWCVWYPCIEPVPEGV
jgi:hypothetical protein